MQQEQTAANSYPRLYPGRPRSNSSSCVSDSSDRLSELEADSLPSRPYSSIGLQRPRTSNGHVDLDFEDPPPHPQSGPRLRQPIEDGSDSPPPQDTGIAYDAAKPYCPVSWQLAGEFHTLSDDVITVGANGYSDTSRSTPYFNISSPYPPYTPDFPNAEIAPPPLTHQATLIYGAPASNHQPIWEYRVTHPLSPPRSKFVFPQVPNTHPHAIPNAYSYSIFPAHLAPFIPCPFSRTQPLREAPTLRVSSSDEVLVSRQRAGLAKQRLVTQGSVAMNKQEQKSVLKLFKETPLEERGMWPLEAIRGYVLEFSLDQKGSFWLQEKLGIEHGCPSAERATLETTLHWIFNELRGSMLTLSMDTFGNFIAQPFYLLCSDLQRKFALAELQPSIAALCKHRHGCRVMQVILRNSDSAARITIADAIRSDIVDISNSEHGNHVVQLALDMICDVPEFSQDLVDHIRPILTGKFGCKVAMHAYHALPGQQADKIVNAILTNPNSLVNDPHANYVWQHIVQHGSVRHREQLISSLSGSFAKLSSKPFASWCCQKALEHANATQREALIGELLQGGPQVFGDLATHKNGTHVFITAIGILKDISWSRITIVQVLSKLEQVKLKRNLSDDVRRCLARATGDLAHVLLFDNN